MTILFLTPSSTIVEDKASRGRDNLISGSTQLHYGNLEQSAYAENSNGSNLSKFNASQGCLVGDCSSSDQKIIILVMMNKEEPFQSIERQGIRTTWASETYPDIHIVFLYADPTLTNPKWESDDQLVVPGKEDFPSMYHKTVQGWQVCLQRWPNFTHMFRTNASSYVNQPLLKEFIKTLPNKSVVASQYISPGLVSGCGYVLSRDIVQRLVESYVPGSDEKHLDDLELSERLKSFDELQWLPAPRYNFPVGDEEGIPESNPQKLPRVMHYRCKRLSDRTQDIRNMLTVHRLRLEQNTGKTNK